MSNNAYIIAWSREGLEALIPIQEYETESEELVLEAVRTGKSPKSKLGGIIYTLKLRARLNSQRVFEVYAIDLGDGFTTKSLEEEFDDNPQPIVDWIRVNGVKIYSDYDKNRYYAAIK